MSHSRQKKSNDNKKTFPKGELQKQQPKNSPTIMSSTFIEKRN